MKKNVFKVIHIGFVSLACASVLAGCNDGLTTPNSPAPVPNVPGETPNHNNNEEHHEEDSSDGDSTDGDEVSLSVNEEPAEDPVDPGVTLPRVEIAPGVFEQRQVIVSSEQIAAAPKALVGFYTENSFKIINSDETEMEFPRENARFFAFNGKFVVMKDTPNNLAGRMRVYSTSALPAVTDVRTPIFEHGNVRNIQMTDQFVVYDVASRTAAEVEGLTETEIAALPVRRTAIVARLDGSGEVFRQMGGVQEFQISSNTIVFRLDPPSDEVPVEQPAPGVHPVLPMQLREHSELPLDQFRANLVAQNAELTPEQLDAQVDTEIQARRARRLQLSADSLRSQLTDGAFPLSEGDVRQESGNIQFANGDVLLMNGNLQLANNGEVLTLQSSGEFLRSNGEILERNGNFRLPNGDVRLANGTLLPAVSNPSNILKLTNFAGAEIAVDRDVTHVKVSPSGNLIAYVKQNRAVVGNAVYCTLVFRDGARVIAQQDTLACTEHSFKLSDELLMIHERQVPVTRSRSTGLFSSTTEVVPGQFRNESRFQFINSQGPVVALNQGVAAWLRRSIRNDAAFSVRDVQIVRGHIVMTTHSGNIVVLDGSTGAVLTNSTVSPAVVSVSDEFLVVLTDRADGQSTLHITNLALGVRGERTVATRLALDNNSPWSVSPATILSEVPATEAAPAREISVPFRIEVAGDQILYRGADHQLHLGVFHPATSAAPAFFTQRSLGAYDAEASIGLNGRVF